MFGAAAWWAVGGKPTVPNREHKVARPNPRFGIGEWLAYLCARL